jgi:N-glycosylase/DNA lyase
MLVQYVAHNDGSETRLLSLPDPTDEVMPGVNWGSASDYFTPAFWKMFAWKAEAQYLPRAFGETLREEIAACMLCGYGIPSEIGIAAFARLKSRGLLEHPRQDQLADALHEPLTVNGKAVRYRFYRAKAKALEAALGAFDHLPINSAVSDVEIRNLLLKLPGVGPKTASYVVRNYMRSDEVAVLDVHITRASKMLRLFPESADPQKQYFQLERLFLDFARALGVRPSVLDNLMWDGMRTLAVATRPR